jgi:hypothetical protein
MQSSDVADIETTVRIEDGSPLIFSCDSGGDSRAVVPLMIDELFPPANVNLAPRVQTRCSPPPTPRPPDGDRPRGGHYIDPGRWARWAAPPRTMEPGILTPPTSVLGIQESSQLVRLNPHAIVAMAHDIHTCPSSASAPTDSNGGRWLVGLGNPNPLPIPSRTAAPGQISGFSCITFGPRLGFHLLDPLPPLIRLAGGEVKLSVLLVPLPRLLLLLLGLRWVMVVAGTRGGEIVLLQATEGGGETSRNVMRWWLKPCPTTWGGAPDLTTPVTAGRRRRVALSSAARRQILLLESCSLLKALGLLLR